ncbi:metallophosphoesterase family protein [Fodinibius sediminis]|uniref:Phosphoesterase, MJ0936 family n=1 Tax=Fodinibius sediminis TaxID=1214077 RepID=A0A521BRM6_9BACT|nr:metallophosphoesterase family protein [Fodinibius sediminis]SMO49190.1 phosphoesterase, MJ0936 family [Fodinibius sediminis]
MRIAAVYDIHGNLPALEAVLQEIYKAGVDCLIVGGDVIAGPLPAETLTLLQNISIPTRFIRGNAESELLRHIAGKEPGGLSERADKQTYWLAKNLTENHKQFLSGWPSTYKLKIKDHGNVLFCHATPLSDIEVFTRQTPLKKLRAIFGGQDASLAVCGHTHMQFDRNIGELRILNAGSVGMPFGHTGADWLLIDTEIVFRHTDYDLSKAAERLRQSNYPHVEDFITNNVLQPPTETKALAMLSQLETLTAAKE